MKKIYSCVAVLTTILLIAVSYSFVSPRKIVSKNFSVFTKIQEPSGICILTNSECAVVSDQGVLYKTDYKGKIISKAKQEGTDFEDVCLANGNLFVSDESTRSVFVYDTATLTLQKIIPLHNSSGRNEGYESITYNSDDGNFILVSEKDPVELDVYDQNFQLIQMAYVNGVGDISSACYFNHKLFLLSDEDHCVLQLNAKTFSEENRISIAVNNPEGLAMTTDNSFLIVSDRMQKLFSFQFTQP